MSAIHGVLRGRTIELASDPGISNGDAVGVVVEVRPLPTENPVWGDGLRRCAGVLSNEWTPDDDRILDELHAERSDDTRLELDA